MYSIPEATCFLIEVISFHARSPLETFRRECFVQQLFKAKIVINVKLKCDKITYAILIFLTQSKKIMH